MSKREQRTIYVKNELWDQIKAEAGKRGIKINELLTKSFKSDSQLDRIEKKLDEVIQFYKEPARLLKTTKHGIEINDSDIPANKVHKWKNPLENLYDT